MLEQNRFHKSIQKIRLGWMTAGISLICFSTAVVLFMTEGCKTTIPPAGPTSQPLPNRPTKATSRVTAAWRSPSTQAAEPREVLSPQEALLGERLAGVTIDLRGTEAVLRVEVQGASNDVNRSHLLMLVNQPVHKGDRLTLNYEARSMGDSGLINVRVGNTTTGWSATVDQDCPLPVGEAWRPYTVSWTAPADVMAKQTDVRLRFGKQAQSLEIRNVQVTVLDAGQAGWVVKAGQQWRAIDLQDPDIVPGSALDFSGWWDGAAAGSYGRVIVNKAGRLAFEKNPEQPVAFWGCSINMGPAGAFSLRHDASTLEGDRTKTPIKKQDIEAFSNRVRNQGYNLFRPHFLDAALMENAQPGQTFDPVALDNFDYLVYCLKKNGIYLYFDAMTRDGGWSRGGGWGGDGINRRQRLYWDTQARQDWADAVKSLLTHVNPYTHTALLDDPVVAALLFCNEQEIDPWGVENFPADVLPGFRAWLQKKYPNDAALAAAWTDKAGKCWLPAGETLKTVTANQFWGDSPRSLDINNYIYEAERDLLAWYEKTIRQIGYQGIMTQFDCGMRFRDVAVRSKLQAVSIHAYRAPVTNWVMKGSRQSQESSIGASDFMRDALFYRWMPTARFLDRPLMVTEYDCEFWNAFRHETGMLIGGYSAFQGFDVLMAHAHPVMLSVDRPMLPYFIGADPIGRATQVVTGLLFARRDVKPATGHVTLGIDDQFVFKQGRFSGGFVWDFIQDRLSLVTGFGITYTNEKGVVQGKVAGAHDYSVHNLPSFDAIMKQISNEAKVTNNRTNLDLGQFETLDGQLFMQRQRSELEVNTPRTQGASLLAGAKVKLPQLEIASLSTDAAISVSALDNAELPESGRLLLVIATDALNSDMAFTGSDRTEMVSIGNTPALIRTGKFTLAITNSNAKTLGAWGLTMTGARAQAIQTRVEGNQLWLDIDTSSLSAPYLFYEIALRK